MTLAGVGTRRFGCRVAVVQGYFPRHDAEFGEQTLPARIVIGRDAEHMLEDDPVRRRAKQEGAVRIGAFGFELFHMGGDGIAQRRQQIRVLRPGGEDRHGDGAPDIAHPRTGADHRAQGRVRPVRSLRPKPGDLGIELPDQPLQHAGDQRILAGKVIEHPALAHPRLPRDRIQRDMPRPVPRRDALRRIENPVPRRAALLHELPPLVLRPARRVTRRKGDSPGDSRFARDARRPSDALYRPDGTVRQEITRWSGAGKGDAAGFYGGAAKIWFTQAGIGWIFWGWGIVGWGVGVVDICLSGMADTRRRKRTSATTPESETQIANPLQEGPKIELR